MRLSNKKLKYIRRHASRESAEQIANQLKIPVREVEKTIRKFQAPVGTKPVVSHTATLEKVCFWILAGMAFLVPLLVSDYLYDSVGGLKRTVTMLLALVMVIIWLFRGYPSGELEVFHSALLAVTGCFLAWSLISIAWAPDGYGGCVKWLHWAACALIFFVALQVLADEKRVRVVLTLIFFSGILVSLVGILQHLAGLDWFPQVAPPAATFGNKNMASHFIVLSIPIGVWLLGSTGRNTIVWLAAGGLASMLTYLAYTQTKAAWVAVGAETLFLGLYVCFAHFRLNIRPKFSLKKRLAVGAAIGVILMMVLGAPQTLQTGDGAESGSAVKIVSVTEFSPGGQSANVRLAIWRNTLTLLKSHPFTGVGLAGFRSYYPATTIDGIVDKGSMRLGLQHYYAHNDYIQLLVELGVVFGILLVWGLFIVAKYLLQLLAPGSDTGQRLIGITTLGGILGLGVNALFSFPLYSPVPPLMLAIYAAIFARAAFATTESGRPRLPMVRFGAQQAALAGAAFITVLLIFWIIIQVPWIKADHYYKLQSIALKKQDYQKMIHWGEKALVCNPHRLDARQYLGQGYLLNQEPVKAKPHLLAYNEAYPHDMKNLYHLGQCYQHLQDHTAAKQVLEHLVRIVPYEGRVHDSLASVYSALGNPARALEEARAAVQYAPGESIFFYNYGVMAHKMGQYEETVRALLKAIELNDRLVNAYGLLGMTLYYQLDRPEQAIAYFQKALALNISPAKAAKIKATLAAHAQAKS